MTKKLPAHEISLLKMQKISNGTTGKRYRTESEHQKTEIEQENRKGLTTEIILNFRSCNAQFFHSRT